MQEDIDIRFADVAGVDEAKEELMEVVDFLKEEENRFANPVGFTINNEMEKILDAFITGVPVSELESNLENIIKVKAVQEFSPSEALSFVFSLKLLIRNRFADQVSKEDLWDFDGQMDDLIKLSFDIYTRCRETIFEIRLKDLRFRGNSGSVTTCSEGCK